MLQQSATLLQAGQLSWDIICLVEFLLFDFTL